MEKYVAFIPAAISAILLAVLILTVVTNIIVQVLKNLTLGRVPTNIIAVAVALLVTLVAFFAVTAALQIAMHWWLIAGAIALGFFVAYAAMFGYDKLKETLEQITRGTPKRL